MAECFSQLESNNPHVVEEVKQKINDQFKIVKEPWLMNGLYDYYLLTNSARAIEILVNVREPHHGYLFDKVSDSIRGSKNDSKVLALTLLGHVIRRQPTWLYNITQHQIFRDLLKLLKNETDILPLLSALLALIVLMPIIPFPIGQFLADVFEIFSRLAAWNCSNPGKIVEEQMVHMQVALYALFQRLYGMYPCNFLAYLRNQYRNKDLSPIFTHTIKPMLATVKMHPSLVTTSKDNETTTERWKKMGAHDVIVECERFSLDLTDRCANESCLFTTSIRSRSGTTTSFHGEPHAFQILKSTPVPCIGSERDFFTPSMKLCPTPPITEATVPTNIPLSHLQGAGQSLIAGISLQSQEGTSPPEAAIEATPETTPIRDLRYTTRQPVQTGVARAITGFAAKTWSANSGNSTPTHSQPSSPMRKDSSPFIFSSDPKHISAFVHPKKDVFANQRLNRLIQDRQYPEMPGEIKNVKLKTISAPPQSPSKRISSIEYNIPRSPVPVQRIESPVSQEDEEVLSIVGRGDMARHPGLRQCDSVLNDSEEIGAESLMDECDLEHGSPCTAGGLHMPNSRSMNEFAKRVSRLRYHSQCAADIERAEQSSGSPATSMPNLKVRRANSCPEMKKIPLIPTKETTSKTLDVTDEEGSENHVEDKLTNGNEPVNNKRCVKEDRKLMLSMETQTDNFWPMPYEHLFLGIFPSLENIDVKPSPAPSPAPYSMLQEKCTTASVYDTLDKYIDISVHGNERENCRGIKEQLQLLHQQLQFERHRRETHAFRNRRLLADARDMKALQEHNSALRDQVQLQQRDIDNLREQLQHTKKENNYRDKDAEEKVTFWESQCKRTQQECKNLRDRNEDLEKELEVINVKCKDLDKMWQNAESTLIDTKAEVKIAKEQAWAGEKGREELETVNKELLLCGEIQLKQQERLADLATLRQSDQEFAKLTEVYKHELKVLNQQLESKSNTLEAFKTRVSELEHMLTQSEDALAAHKRLLNDVKEECHEKIKAVESKYQTQLGVNGAMGESILELWEKIESSSRRNVYSPDTSSCHEVNASTDRTNTAAGLSPHSSPLSVSLASSEGSIAFMNPDTKEMKNLQIIADQKETFLHKPLVREESISDPVILKHLPSSSATKHD